MTFLELVNKVLRGLREDTVESLSGTYPRHIGQLVNQAKEEIEDMGPWEGLRDTVNGTAAIGVDTVDLTADTNERSYLQYLNNVAQVFTYDAELEAVQLHLIQPNEMANLWLFNDSQPDSQPVYASYTKTNGGLIFRLFPAPSETLTLRTRLIVPQAELTATETELLIPSGPVWRRALVMAMEERGEDFAGPIERVRRDADNYLMSAVMSDFLAQNTLTFEGQ